MMKYLIGWGIVLVLRLIPFRPANVEPLMATLMPFAKKYGYGGGFLFACFSMIGYDIITNNVGPWTIWTSLTYGLIGVLSHRFFKNRKGTTVSYVVCSILGTLIFDAITGVVMGPLMYGQPVMEAFTGQIPFTVQHLASSIVSSAVLSVAVERWLVENPALEIRLKQA